LDAYLDIETTGFIGGNSYPTVVGIAVDFPGDWLTTQLVGDRITPGAVLRVLGGVTTIYTFNGAGFDLPFLAWKPGVDLRRRFEHQDLMRVSRRAGLKGGLKVIETALGIPRNLPDMQGYDAVLLWETYLREDNPSALDMLLEYNREDVENLRVLRNILEDEDWNLD
jgi:uncharacterized protein YprB with RNaseH-like and TPR domain